jgi:NTE family protein
MPKLKKIGLALGSGSARGWSHIGVIRVLQEARIDIDVVCGSSIGALVGGAFASGQLDQLEKMAREFVWSDLLGLLDVPIPRSGLINGDKVENYFRARMSDRNIEDLPMPFAAVATDLASSEEVWLRKGSLIEAIRSSISIPGMLTPSMKDGRLLVDGGLVDPIPVSLCRALGADLVIAVNPNTDVKIYYETKLKDGTTLPDKHPTEEQGHRLRDLLFAGLTIYIVEKINKGKAILFGHPKDRGAESPTIRGQLADYLSDYINLTMKQGKTITLGRIGEDGTYHEPAIFEIIIAAINQMADRIARQRLAGDPPEVMILPHASQVGPLEFNKADEVIEAGRRATVLMLPMLRDMIGDIETI